MIGLSSKVLSNTNHPGILGFYDSKIVLLQLKQKIVFLDFFINKYYTLNMLHQACLKERKLCVHLSATNRVNSDRSEYVFPLNSKVLKALVLQSAVMWDFQTGRRKSVTLSMN